MVDAILCVPIGLANDLTACSFAPAPPDLRPQQECVTENGVEDMCPAPISFILIYVGGLPTSRPSRTMLVRRLVGRSHGPRFELPFLFADPSSRRFSIATSCLAVPTRVERKTSADASLCICSKRASENPLPNSVGSMPAWYHVIVQYALVRVFVFFHGVLPRRWRPSRSTFGSRCAFAFNPTKLMSQFWNEWRVIELCEIRGCLGWAMVGQRR